MAGVREVWAGEDQLEPVEVIYLGDRFVTLAHNRMRGQASGVPLTESDALVSTVKDGKIVHHQEYYDHWAALEAVGLPAYAPTRPPEG